MQNACHEQNAVAAAIDSVFREDGGRLTATLIRVFGDFDLAEDALQEAAAAALTHWSSNGVPRNPAGWLFTAARRSALDRVRRDATLRASCSYWCMSSIPPLSNRVPTCLIHRSKTTVYG